MFSSSKLIILVFPFCLCIRPKERPRLSDNLKANSRKVTNSMTFMTKSSNQNFIIFLNKIQTTIIGTKAVIALPFLMSWTPTHFLMAEFGFNLYIFQHKSLCMESTYKRLGLQGCAQIGFLVLLSCHFWSCWWLPNFLAVWMPQHLPILPTPQAWAKEI